MKNGLAFIFAALVTLVIATAASAAQPTKTVVSFDDPALEAEIAGDFTSACHAPIAVDLSGKVEIIVLDKSTRAGAIEIDAYQTRGTFTNTATGATATLVDAGPDLVKYDPKTGDVVLAITGRSITGSGVIGRFVVDLDTGEILSVSGLAKGDFVANLCAELT
jgi:hypothetical protein